MPIVFPDKLDVWKTKFPLKTYSLLFFSGRQKSKKIFTGGRGYGGWLVGHEVGDLLLVDNLAVSHRADIMAHEVSIPGIAAPRVLHRSTVRGVVGVGDGES